jgi:hypothetical protein
MALPAELTRLLLVNNGAAEFDADAAYCRGAAFLPGDHRLLCSAEIAQQGQSLNDIEAGYGGDMIGWWWHPQWVLFARHVAADGLAIDQQPGPGQGRVGELMHSARPACRCSTATRQARTCHPCFHSSGRTRSGQRARTVSAGVTGRGSRQRALPANARSPIWRRIRIRMIGAAAGATLHDRLP